MHREMAKLDMFNRKMFIDSNRRDLFSPERFVGAHSYVGVEGFRYSG